MKKVIIYGEFLDKSTTGIAYINSLLNQVLLKLDYEVLLLNEPRAKDYNQIKFVVKKRFYFKDFIKVLFNIVSLSKKDISFITISQNNLGLLKTLIIAFFLKLKTKKLFVYIHRGDLHLNLEKSFYRKLVINLLITLSHKVVFLSDIISENFKQKSYINKFIIVPNALNEFDTKKSKILYKKRIKYNYFSLKNTYKAIYCGNVQFDKGINKISHSIQEINKIFPSKKVTLDVYGMPFERLYETKNQIEYKGILNHRNRLEVMSKYDFLIIASKSEGLPMILIECLSIGLPFITTKVGAIEDVLIKDYPYICTFNKQSIVKTIEKIIYDFDNDEKKIKEILDLNNRLFNQRFQYKNFLENIKNKIV